MPAPLDALFGGSPVLLRVYADDGSSAGTIAGSRLAAVTVHRGRRTATENVQPGTIGLTVAGQLAVDGVGGLSLDLTRRVRLELDPAVMAASFGAGVIPAAALPRWTGQLTDLGDVAVDPRTLNLATPATGSSLLARVLSYRLDPGDAGSFGDSNRVVLVDVLNAVYGGDPGVRITPWNLPSVPASVDQWAALVAARPDTYFANVWPAGATSADYLDLIAASARGEIIDRRDGRVDFIAPADRRTGPAAFVVDASQAIAPLAAGKHMADILNDVRVADGAGAAHRRQNTQSIAAWGDLDGDVTTNLDTAAQCNTLGDDLLAAFSQPRWAISQLALDLGKLFRRNGPAPAAGLTDRALVAKLLAAEIGDPIILGGALPATSVITAGGSYFIVGVDETFSRTAWTMTLAVQPAMFLAPAKTWAEVLPATLRWNDLPASLTWQYFGAFEPA